VLCSCGYGCLQERLNALAADMDSSACDDTGSVASGDDVRGSTSSSFLTPLCGMVKNQLRDHLLRTDSASSDIEDAVESQPKQVLNGEITLCFTAGLVTI